MTTDPLRIEHRPNGHVQIVLNRPDAHNAINDAMMDRFAEALETLINDSSVRVLTVHGEGPSFCAGADLKFFLEALEDPPRLAAFIRRVKDVFARLEAFPGPVIAVAHGFVLAGGLELLMACDLALVAEDAVLGDQHINFGLIPGGGATQRLPRLIGMRKAKELMMTGRRISGTEAESLGLVNKAVPRDALETTAQAWAEELAEKTPTGLRTVKELLRSTEHTTLDGGLDLEEATFLNYARLGDMREGLMAFKEKRKPRYR